MTTIEMNELAATWAAFETARVLALAQQAEVDMSQAQVPTYYDELERARFKGAWERLMVASQREASTLVEPEDLTVFLGGVELYLEERIERGVRLGMEAAKAENPDLSADVTRAGSFS